MRIIEYIYILILVTYLLFILSTLLMENIYLDVISSVLLFSFIIVQSELIYIDQLGYINNYHMNLNSFDT